MCLFNELAFELTAVWHALQKASPHQPKGALQGTSTLEHNREGSFSEDEWIGHTVSFSVRLAGLKAKLLACYWLLA